MYALDGATRQVTAVSIRSFGSQALPLGDLSDPVAIRTSSGPQNQQLLFVAGRSDQVVRIFDLGSRQFVEDVPLGFQPTRLDPFGNNSLVIASRSQAASPLWLFTNSARPGAYFVPAIQAAPEGVAGVGGTQ